MSGQCWGSQHIWAWGSGTTGGPPPAGMTCGCGQLRWQDRQPLLDALAEVERLEALSQGRLELFQHSEESRAYHFQRAEAARQALEEIANYQMRDEQSGYSDAYRIRDIAIDALAAMNSSSD